MAWFMGIDIGSGTSKGVITKDGESIAVEILASGINYNEVALKLREKLTAKARLDPKEIAYAIATGHGSKNVSFCQEQVSDIRCCARGINRIYPSARTIVDIQGQSSQVISIDEKGHVINHAASEKCATGSGRFFNILANVLQLELADIGSLSLTSNKPIYLNTGCAVFCESEVVTRVSEGVPVEDILAGAVKVFAEKMGALINRVGMRKQCAISGGGTLNPGIVKALEQKLKTQLLVPQQPQLVTALGAACLAEEKWQ